MKCDETKLIDYYYNELDEDARAFVENHIAVCQGCREGLFKLSSLFDKVSVEGKTPVPSIDIRDYLGKVYEKAETKSILGWIAPFPRVVYTGLVTILLIFFVAGGVYIYRHNEDKQIFQHYEVVQNLDLLEDMELIQDLEDIEMVQSKNI